MNKKEFLLFLLFTSFVTCLFFAKVIFYRQVPLPGDLLVDTAPFKTESYLGFGPGGYPNKAQGRDVITQLYPWEYFVAQQVAHGNLPLWNPYNFSGNPQIANYQTGFFYPLHLIFLFLPFVPAWTVFIVLQPILAMVFMYLYLKELQVHRLAAFLGAVAFGFSSYMIVWLEWGNIGHTLLWLPLLLFATKRFVSRGYIGFLLLLTVAGVCCLTAGYIQGAWYVLSTVFLYGLLQLWQVKKTKKSLVYFISAFVAMGFLASVQIVPTVITFLASSRGSYSQEQIQNLLQPWYYPITILVSEFFGNPATRNYYLPITYFERVMYPGIPILFFAFFAFGKIKNFEVKFFGLLALFSLLMTTNLPGVSWFYTLPLPVIATTVPTRFLSIFLFSVVILAAYGIDAWVHAKNLTYKLPVVFGGLYLFFWIGLFFAQQLHPLWITNITIARHNVILSTVLAGSTIAIFFLRNKYFKISSILLLIVVIADFYYLFVKFTPFTPPELIYPSTPVIQYLQQHAGINRSWGYGNAYIPANYATYFGIYSADGYDPLFNKEYDELLSSSETGEIHLPLSRTDANIAPGYGTDDLKTNRYRQKILDLLGVKYILNLRDGNSVAADNNTFPPEKYSLIWNKDPWQIYENRNVLPRAFLANQYELVTQKNAISSIYKADIARVILLSTKPSLTLDPQAKGNLQVASYQPNTISMDINTSGNELLFLSDTYDSGWKATIDGKNTKVYRADVAFRAVEVPKGKHTVTFYYQPLGFDVGLIITVVSLVISGSFLLVRKLF